MHRLMGAMSPGDQMTHFLRRDGPAEPGHYRPGRGRQGVTDSDTTGNLFLTCLVQRAEPRQHMLRARPQPDPFAQGRIPSGPCTHAPLRSVNQHQGWRCKRLGRLVLAAAALDRQQSSDRPFSPRPVGGLWKSSRIPIAGSIQQSSSTADYLVFCCHEDFYDDS